MQIVDLNNISAEDAVTALRKYASSGLLGNIAMGGGIGAGVGAGGGLIAEYMAGRKRKNYMHALLSGGVTGGVLGAGAGAVYNGMSGASNKPENQSAAERNMAAVAQLRQDRAEAAANGDTAGAAAITQQLTTYGEGSSSPPSDLTTPAIVRGAVGGIAGATAAQALPVNRDYSDTNAGIKNLRSTQATATEAALDKAHIKSTADFHALPANKPIDLEALKLDSQYQPKPLTAVDIIRGEVEPQYRKDKKLDAASLKGAHKTTVDALISGRQAAEIADNATIAKALTDRLYTDGKTNDDIAERLKVHDANLTTAQKAVTAFPAAQAAYAASAQHNRWSNRFALPAATGSPAAHPDVQKVFNGVDLAPHIRAQRADQLAAGKMPITAGNRGTRALRGGVAGAAVSAAAPHVGSWLAKTLVSGKKP